MTSPSQSSLPPSPMESEDPGIKSAHAIPLSAPDRFSVNVLFSKDPETLTDEEFAKGVEILRAQRVLWVQQEAGIKPKRATKAKPVAMDAHPGKAPLTMEDLGL